MILGSRIRYDAGDHVAVYPINNQVFVSMKSVIGYDNAGSEFRVYLYYDRNLQPCFDTTHYQIPQQEANKPN